MTTFNKSTLQNLWINGFVPQGSDYTNLIQSQVNIAETALQAMAGPLSVTELNAPLVSAANATFSGTVSITGALTGGSLNLSSSISAASINLTGNVSASNLFSSSTINGSILNIGNVSATSNVVVGGAILATGNIVGGAAIAASAGLSGNNLIVTTDISAGGNVYCSALRIQSVAIISAAGTTQATGAAITGTINRLQGVTDGQTTGFVLQANKTGLTQYLINEANISANLWPPTGGKINNAAANAVFVLAGNTSYTVFHYAASAYGVK